MNKMETRANSTGEDANMDSIDDVSRAIFESVMKLFPGVHNIQERRQEDMEKEQELIPQLQKNLEHGREVLATGAQRPFPFDPEELEKELLEHIGSLALQQANIVTSMPVLKDMIDRTEEAASVPTMPFSVPGRALEIQQAKDVLEYLQQIQPGLANRTILLWTCYQNHKRRRNEAWNMYRNIPSANTSTTDHVQPDHRRTDFQSTHDSVSHADLGRELQHMNLHGEEQYEEEGEEGFEYEELPIQQWGRHWDVPR